MKMITHLCMGLAIGVVFSILTPDFGLFLVFFASFFALLPDLFDFRVLRCLNHRNILTHNFCSPLLLLALIPGLLWNNIWLAVCGIIAFESHQGLDVINPTGVFVGCRKIAGHTHYDNIFVNLLMIAFAMAAIIFGIIL